MVIFHSYVSLPEGNGYYDSTMVRTPHELGKEAPYMVIFSACIWIRTSKHGEGAHEFWGKQETGALQHEL